MELLAAYAQSRAWVNGSGLADETRTGRQVLKDYTSGRLVYCEWPPGTSRPCPYDDGLQTFTGDPELLKYGVLHSRVNCSESLVHVLRQSAYLFSRTQQCVNTLESVPPIALDVD